MIPKKINICWNDKNVINSTLPLITNGLKNIVDLNPNWDVTIHDDNDIEHYLQHHLNKDQYDLIKNTHIVEKCDVWRLVKLYNEGGMYIDIDRFFNVVLDDVIEDGVMCYLPTCEDHSFTHDVMLSAPNNPIFFTTLNLIFSRRKQGYISTYLLGPQTYMHGITLNIVGEIVDINPGKQKMDLLRETIKNISFLRTFREVLPNQSFVFKGGTYSLNDWENMKREFYKQHNIRHWTGEW